METIKYILDKYKLEIGKNSIIEIPNVTRLDLARLFHELKFTKGAEIGVEQGIYSEVLLKENPDLNLLSVDAWAAYEGYRDHMSQADMDVIYNKAQERLRPYSDRSNLLKCFSVPAADYYPDEHFDFVYLDANHEFANVVNDITAWEKKVKVGGIIAGHDYILRRKDNFMMHVPYAINAYCGAYQIKPLFLMGRKGAATNTKPGKELRESTRSWFYVKQPRDPMKPGWNGWNKVIDGTHD